MVIEASHTLSCGLNATCYVLTHVKSGRHLTKSWVANARLCNAVSSQQLLYNNGERAYLSV